jgi:hypothetical protein
MRLSALLAALLLLSSACSDDTADPKPSPTPPDMAAGMDADPSSDLAQPDQDAPDQDAPDMDMPDLTPDMDTPDMTEDMTEDMDAPDLPPRDPRCMYLDYDVYYVKCGPLEMHKLLRKMEDRDLGEQLCPVYYTLNGMEYATAQQAISANQCNGACQYVATMSVSLLHCERRTGYIKWTADSCPDIYEFPEGVYYSVEQWRMANPCPG